MFPFLFGIFGADWLRNLFFVKNNRYSFMGFDNRNLDEIFSFDYSFSDEVYDFIKDYEGFSSKPYLLPNEKHLTIGYGSTFIFSVDGKSYRRVRPTDRMTKEQAISNLKLFFSDYNYNKKMMEKTLKAYNVKLHKRVVDMLYQIAYGSGSFYKSQQLKNIVIKCNMITNVEYLSNVVLNEYISYLKNLRVYHPNLKTKFRGYGLAWSRRAFGIKQYILGLNWSKSYTERVINKPY